VSTGGGIDFPGYAAKPTARALALEGVATKHAVEARAFVCATFNAWFQGPDAPLRNGGLLEAIREADADVVFLQETTVPLFEMLSASAAMGGGFCRARAPFRADAVPSHGLAIFSRFPLRDITLHPLPTHMGRCVLTCVADLDGKPFTFATTHLESMKPYADTRAAQLREIFRILEPATDAVLAGDFNFCASWPEENARIDARYRDVWPALRPSEPGFTQDTDANPMLAKAKGEAKRVRIDRVLLRSDAGRWRAESIALIGTRPVDPKHARIFPSDHFGLRAVIARS